MSGTVHLATPSLRRVWGRTPASCASRRRWKRSTTATNRSSASMVSMSRMRGD
jgi:hypothetical protein